MTPTRFVLLRHEVPGSFPRPSHWDLLLERDAAGWTWALDELPRGWPGGGSQSRVAALRLPDHRLHYLDYEGPISGDRGIVTRVLGGECQWRDMESDDRQEQLTIALTADDWSGTIRLTGARFQAEWQLELVGN